MNRQHKSQKEEPPIFLADQRDPMTGFGNKTVLQLLSYLHTTFGSISEK
jgi:hypothetical protein